MEIGVKGDQFVDELTGKPLELAGSHTWNNVQRIEGETVGLGAIVGNFTRLWTLETKAADFGSSIWGSNTPGLQRIKDGPFKEDGSLNGAYYRRLEEVVRKAEKRDIVTGVVLFEGSIQRIFPGAWENHPFNGLGPTRHEDIHARGEWNSYQRAHVKRVTEVLEPYGNVIYEVGNELARESVRWFQGKVVEWVQKFTDKPVGVSYASAVYVDQSWLKRAGADWIVPGNGARAGGVRKIPGFKGPQVLDTDHAWPLNSNPEGLRTAWLQGRPLWLMDGLDGSVLRNQQTLAPDRAFIDSVVS
jgi:hypothetical protein